MGEEEDAQASRHASLIYLLRQRKWGPARLNETRQSLGQPVAALVARRGARHLRRQPPQPPALLRHLLLETTCGGL